MMKARVVPYEELVLGCRRMMLFFVKQGEGFALKRDVFVRQGGGFASKHDAQTKKMFEVRRIYTAVFLKKACGVTSAGLAGQSKYVEDGCAAGWCHEFLVKCRDNERFEMEQS
jgi:hypothetical protein